MGVLHFICQTPLDWFCKRQNTVNTVTYGSEFAVARGSSDQIADHRYTLRMMDLPLNGPAWMFADNEGVVTSSTIRQSSLHTCFCLSSCREAIAAKILYFLHISGNQNPSDVGTKLLPYSLFWPLIEPILFWKGDTSIASLAEGSDTNHIGQGHGMCQSK
jgi:hypothetical protein